MYTDVLQVISKSYFFEKRHMLLPWCPTACCGFTFFGIGLLIFVMLYKEYVYYTHIPSDGDAIDNLKFRAKEQNITENELIHNQVRGSIRVMILVGLIIVFEIGWLICCLVNILLVR